MSIDGAESAAPATADSGDTRQHEPFGWSAPAFVVDRFWSSLLRRRCRARPAVELRLGLRGDAHRLGGLDLWSLGHCFDPLFATAARYRVQGHERRSCYGLILPAANRPPPGSPPGERRRRSTARSTRASLTKNGPRAKRVSTKAMLDLMQRKVRYFDPRRGPRKDVVRRVHGAELVSVDVCFVTHDAT